MRRFLCMVLIAACMPLAARAQLLHVGLRGGVNVSDVSVERFALADAVVSSGRIKAGYQFAFMARTNLTRHLHLQAEIEYACGVNAYRIDRMTSARSISIRSRRLNLPLQLGVQLGAARLFAGASFVIGDWTGNSDAARLGVDYDMPDVAIVGGASVHFSNMFVEARLRSATGSRHALFRIGDAVRSMAIRRNMLWSLSFGIFF